MKMNFAYQRIDEKLLMHSESDSREMISGFDTEEIIEELFHSLLQGCEVGLEQ